MVVCACSGDDGTSTGDDAPPDGAAACTESDTSRVVMVPTIETQPGLTSIASWKLVAATSPTSVIGYAETAERAQRLAFLDPTTTTDIVTTADALYYPVTAAPIGGGCAVTMGKQDLGRACPGMPYEVADLDADVSTGDPLFAVEASGSTWVFTQTFASFTIIERSSAGAWKEHEQFESSISFPTDALAAGSETVACFIDAADRAVVQYGNAAMRGTVEATWCKLALAADGQTLHVLTDVGRTSLPLASVTGAGTLTLTPLTTPFSTRPERLVMLDGAPHALMHQGTTIDLVPLDGAAPTSLPAPDESYVLDFDAATRRLSVISELVDSSGSGPEYPQTLRFQTHCL